MSEKIRVSILITSYNRINDLKETLKKTKLIKYNNYETVIIDNGSTDGTGEYLKNIKNENYKIFIISKNKGPAYAHDLGMKKCEGDYIITIDDDCFLQPDVVRHTVEIFNKNNTLSAIGYGFMNPNVFFSNEKFFQDYFNIDEVKNINLNKCNEPIIATSGAAFRKSSLKKINYYDLNWFHCEDWELSLKLIANGFSTMKISSLVAFHKSSPLNRDFEFRRYHQIQGAIWLILKYYPLKLMIIETIVFFIKTIYFSLMYRRISYVLAFLYSFKKIKKVLKNRIIIPYKKLKNMNKAHNTIFI